MISSRYLHWSLQCFLDVHSFTHDGLVQFALECQQIHVGLGLWDKLTDLFGGKTILMLKSSDQTELHTQN